MLLLRRLSLYLLMLCTKGRVVWLWLWIRSVELFKQWNTLFLVQARRCSGKAACDGCASG